MRRRDFVKAVASLASGWPVIARGQQTEKMARIGYLALRGPLQADDAFLQGLQQLGWNEGQNIFIDRRFSAGDPERLNRSAAELVRLKVDVIVACATAGAQAAKNATTSIPIVFASTGDPVGQGFVASLARPGGNMTGTSFDASPEITTKQLQLATQIVPNASRVAVLWNPTVPFIRTYWNAAQNAAVTLGITLQSEEVSESKDFAAAFDDIDQQHADALFVLSDSLMTLNRAILAQLALKHRLPAVYGHDQYTAAGGLISYGPFLPDLYRGAAAYVDKILKGIKPSEIPVQEPTKFELVINLKAAKALGLAIPQSLITTADEVIE